MPARIPVLRLAAGGVDGPSAANWCCLQLSLELSSWDVGGIGDWWGSTVPGDGRFALPIYSRHCSTLGEAAVLASLMASRFLFNFPLICLLKRVLCTNRSLLVSLVKNVDLH